MSVPKEVLGQLNGMSALVGISANMYKIRKGKTYYRKFSVPADQTAIHWESAKKRGTKSKILISRLRELIVGQQTTVFKEFVQKDPSFRKKEHLSFSVLYDVLPSEAGGKITQDTLDVVTETETEAKRWIEHLGLIIGATQACLDVMKGGCVMTKCRPKKQYDRTYFLTDDMKLRWEPSKKDGRIDLQRAKFIRVGQATKAFRRARNVRQFEKLSFSIVYRPDDPEDGAEEMDEGFETLDLICKSRDEFRVWVTGLQSVISGARDSQVLLQKGIDLTVVTRKRHPVRRFTLGPDMTFFEYSSGGRNRRILIKDIKELRRGQNTAVWKAVGDKPMFTSALCFSVIYGSSYRSLNLMAASQEDYDDWMVGLDDLLFTVFEAPRSVNVMSDTHVLAMFEKEVARQKVKHRHHHNPRAGGTGGNATLSAKAVEKLLFTDETLKTHQNLARLQRAVESAGGALDASGFVRLYREVSNRPELGSIFRMGAQNMFSPGSKHSLDRLRPRDDALELTMSPEQLRDFLVHHQKSYTLEELSVHDCAKMIADHETMADGEMMGAARLSRVGFTSLMLSSMGDAFNPMHDDIYQDMTRPLSEYFISSSHNTYLEGAQVRGKSSAEAYIRSFQRCARCVELDCWDGKDGQPIITHGNTFTSPVSFREVVLAINKYAFVESPYPVILSLENHCSVPQQRVMASIFQEVFGDKLVAVPEEDFDRLPSPEALKNKILLKGKAPVGLRFKKVILSVDKDGTESFKIRWEKDAASGTDVKLEETELNPDRPVVRTAKELSDMVVYCTPVAFQGWVFAENHQKCWQMVSFNEGTVSSFANDPAQAVELTKFAKRFNVRVYPNGTRVDSSNFNPQDFWNAGCQMVSLNFQTDGAAMQLNDGRFRQNGSCGYVLKPAVLRDPSINFRPLAPIGTPLEGCKAQYVSLQIISAQNLPRPRIITPYVSLEVHGLAVDNLSAKTVFVKGEGYAPFWNQKFTFPVSCPDLAMLRFVVKDFRGTFRPPGTIAQMVAPLGSLRQGYRHLQLYTANGQAMSSSLFIHLSLEEGVERSAEWWEMLAKTRLRNRELLQQQDTSDIQGNVHLQLIRNVLKNKVVAKRRARHNIKLRPLGNAIRNGGRRYNQLLAEASALLKEAQTIRQKLLVMRDRAEAPSAGTDLSGQFGHGEILPVRKSTSLADEKSLKVQGYLGRMREIDQEAQQLIAKIDGLLADPKTDLYRVCSSSRRLKGGEETARLSINLNKEGINDITRITEDASAVGALCLQEFSSGTDAFGF